MKKCNHCGVFVPAEKAFCPNCSEPMEEEESSNRANSFNSEMMATIRDDPEQYKHLFKQAAQKKPPASAQAEEPPAPSPAPPPVQSFTPSPPPMAPPPVAEQPPVANYYSMPQSGYAPADGAKSTGRRYLVFGLIAFTLLLLVFIILVAFKVIDIGLFS